MTDQDQININLQRQIDAQTARIDNVLAKVDMLVMESQQQREDIRRLQDRQDEERRKHDADMKEMNAKIDANYQDLTKQLHINFIQTMMGVGGMIVALGAFIIGVLK